MGGGRRGRVRVNAVNLSPWALISWTSVIPGEAEIQQFRPFLGPHYERDDVIRNGISLS